MGFMDNSGEIFIDAVLTDLGREKLARNDGSFSITRFRLSDDEIDYRFWNELTGSDSKDRKILDTPIFEAFTNEVVALRYPLMTIRNARLQYLPSLTSDPSTPSLGQGQNTAATITVQQDIASTVSVIPGELIDVNYSVEMDNDLLFMSDQIPISITPFGTGKYIISADTTQSAKGGGTICKFGVKVQTLTESTFDTLVGASVLGRRTISTTIIVVGQQSGLNIRIPVSIVEAATATRT